MYSVNEQYDIEVTRGDTVTLRIDLSGRDLPEGSEAVFTVKKNVTDEETVLQKRFNASDEVLVIVLSHEETNLEPGTYFWDVRLLIPLEEGGWEVYTPMSYAALTVTAAVGTSIGAGSGADAHPDLPVIPQLIQEMRNALLSLHPVGSLYLSLDDTDPSAYFGGTWERIQDTFLLAAGSKYPIGTTGGEASHRLLSSEIPSFSVQQVRSLSPTTQTIRSASSGSAVEVMTDVSFQTQTVSTGSSNATHNNMPPYLAVYVWKRTA